MLVVDRIKLIFLHQTDQMGKLHGNDTTSTQQSLHSFNKIIDVRNMCKYIIADQKISLNTLIYNIFCRARSKKLYNQ